MPMEVTGLRPFQKKIDLVVKVVQMNDAREVSSKIDNTQHKVTEALVGDATGTVLLTLWDDAINSIEVGKVYSVQNSYTSTFRNSLRLNLGRYGKMEAAAQEIEVKTDNNISEKELSLPRRGGNYGSN
jgi:replication factor A1